MRFQTVDTNTMDPIVFANTWNGIQTSAKKLDLHLTYSKGAVYPFQLRTPTRIAYDAKSLFEIKTWLDSFALWVSRRG